MPKSRSKSQNALERAKRHNQQIKQSKKRDRNVKTIHEKEELMTQEINKSKTIQLVLLHAINFLNSISKRQILQISGFQGEQYMEYVLKELNVKVKATLSISARYALLQLLVRLAIYVDAQREAMENGNDIVHIPKTTNDYDYTLHIIWRKWKSTIKEAFSKSTNDVDIWEKTHVGIYAFIYQLGVIFGLGNGDDDDEDEGSDDSIDSYDDSLSEFSSDYGSSSDYED